MKSQPGKETIATHILPSISQSKGNETIKFGQLIEYNKISIFKKNHAENETRRLVPVLFMFYKKALYEAKVNDINSFLSLSLSLFVFKSSDISTHFR